MEPKKIATDVDVEFRGSSTTAPPPAFAAVLALAIRQGIAVNRAH